MHSCWAWGWLCRGLQGVLREVAARVGLRAVVASVVLHLWGLLSRGAVACDNPRLYQFSSAAVAQWIEYWPPKPRVVGSIPASRTSDVCSPASCCLWG